jgi:hypothetical protein
MDVAEVHNQMRNQARYNVTVDLVSITDRPVETNSIDKFIKGVKSTVDTINNYNANQYINYFNNFFVVNGSTKEFTPKTIQFDVSEYRPNTKNLVNVPTINMVGFRRILLDEMIIKVVARGSDIKSLKGIQFNIAIIPNKNYLIDVIVKLV